VTRVLHTISDAMPLLSAFSVVIRVETTCRADVMTVLAFYLGHLPELVFLPVPVVLIYLAWVLMRFIRVLQGWRE
jgi:hypothetical protein